VERLVEADDERRHDDHEDVFLDGDAEELDPGPEFDGEDADLEGVPVPDVRQGVERGDGDRGTSERVRAVEEGDRERTERHLRRQVRVVAEDGADVGEHAPAYAPQA